MTNVRLDTGLPRYAVGTGLHQEVSMFGEALSFDVAVIGSGVGALRAAIGASTGRSVVVLSHLPEQRLSRGGPAVGPYQGWTIDDLACTARGEHIDAQVFASLAAHAAADLGKLRPNLDVEALTSTFLMRPAAESRSLKKMLYQTALASGVSFMGDTYVESVVRTESNEAVWGVRVYRADIGQFEVVRAPSVVVASDDSLRMFSHGINRLRHGGDGLTAARRANVALVHMADIVVHPLRVFGTPYLLPSSEWSGKASLRGKAGTVATAGDGPLPPVSEIVGALKNDQGLGSGYLEFLPDADAAQRKGRLNREMWEDIQDILQLDSTTDPVPVVPAPHWNHGGLATAEGGFAVQDGSTCELVQGLFAIGQSRASHCRKLSDVPYAQSSAFQIAEAAELGDFLACESPTAGSKLEPPGASGTASGHWWDLLSAPRDASFLLGDLRYMTDAAVSGNKFEPRSIDLHQLRKFANSLKDSPDQGFDHADRTYTDPRALVELDTLFDLSIAMAESEESQLAGCSGAGLAVLL